MSVISGGSVPSLAAGSAAIVFALGAVFLAAGTAWGHTELVSSDPAEGASVATLPASVELTFSEAIGSAGAHVVVTDPSGERVGLGKADVVDDTVTQQTTGEGPAGEYALAYRVVSADGHPISGELGFRVRTADDDGPADPPAERGPETGPEPSTEPESAAAPPSAAGEDSAAEQGFVRRHATHLGLGAVGLAAGALLLGVGIRGRHRD